MIKTHQSSISIKSKGRSFTEITYQVQEAVHHSGIRQGIANVFVQHTSCSLTICENADPDVRLDLETIFSNMVKDGDRAYRHRLEGADDMAAHARSIITGMDLSIPVGHGRLLLGTWQGLYLWEHRYSSHHRNVIVTIMGSGGNE